MRKLATRREKDNINAAIAEAKEARQPTQYPGAGDAVVDSESSAESQHESEDDDTVQMEPAMAAAFQNIEMPEVRFSSIIMSLLVLTLKCICC